MVKQNEGKKAADKPASDKPKRKMPTQEERVARIEAELAEARRKLEAKAKRAQEKNQERLATLVSKRDKLNAEIAELEAQVGQTAGAEPTSEQVSG